ncbi:hypothetical protein NEISICOT_00540 [Neisseria sicca ATCC 29256]|uniref:Uncharacterized protein n=1 Tax=Neisseria sicca ATCC 29256 TaxID=547045 RepID=C6M202_NEISI|nr:hypothetical protein NEISICOT_00540 [Neisseria sicca ATCC 29256]
MKVRLLNGVIFKLPDIFLHTMPDMNHITENRFSDDLFLIQ